MLHSHYYNFFKNHYIKWEKYRKFCKQFLYMCFLFVYMFVCCLYINYIKNLQFISYIFIYNINYMWVFACGILFIFIIYIKKNEIYSKTIMTCKKCIVIIIIIYCNCTQRTTLSAVWWWCRKYVILIFI